MSSDGASVYVYLWVCLYVFFFNTDSHKKRKKNGLVMIIVIKYHYMNVWRWLQSGMFTILFHSSCYIFHYPLGAQKKKKSRIAFIARVLFFSDDFCFMTFSFLTFCESLCSVWHIAWHHFFTWFSSWVMIFMSTSLFLFYVFCFFFVRICSDGYLSMFPPKHRDFFSPSSVICFWVITLLILVLTVVLFVYFVSG